MLTAGDPLPGESLADHVVTFNQLEAGLWRVVVYSPTNNVLRSGTAVLLPLNVNAAAPIGLHPVDFSDPVVISAAEGVALSPVSIFAGGVSLGDLDLDGVFDAEEAGAANDGDANTDGTQDSEQAHVASVQNAVDGEYLTLAVDDDLAFMQVTAQGSPSAGDMPAGVDFPWGFLDFELEGLKGGIRTVVLTLPGGMVANAYYHYGPTPDNLEPHWYEFLFDGESGAEFDGDRVLIHFQDGKRGDHDLVLDGVIRALGGAGRQDPYVLWMPLYKGEAGQFTGFAVSNFSPRRANFAYDAHGTGGVALDVPNNPAEFQLLGGMQQAIQGFQIFGVQSDSEQLGWVEITSDNDLLGGFFQFGSDTLSRLDGSVAFSEQSAHLYLTRIFEGTTAFRGQPATTMVSVVNPNPDPIALTLKLVGKDLDDAPVMREEARQLPGRGFLFESVEEIFGKGTAVSGGYIEIEVSAGTGAIAFEQIQLQEKETIIGLNASFGNEASESFSAQLASLPGLYTNTNLINTSNQTRTSTVSAIGGDGSSLADPVDIELAPGEQVELDADELFLDAAPAGRRPQGEVLVGSLRVVSDGPGVLGDVIFGDGVDFEYAASLPLQTETLLEAVFSQVANIPGFFTGLALYNPSLETAEIEITVVTAAGVVSGQVIEELEPGERFARTVVELVPESNGQAGGYVLIRSSAGVIAQVLFGVIQPSGQITLFSAVPPTVIEGS